MFGEGRNRVDREVPPCLMKGGSGGTTMFGEGRKRADREVPPCLVKGGSGGTTMFGEGWIGRYHHAW